jgi:hypothetical protein
MAEPLREPGWYRLTEHGWTPVDDTTAEAELAAGKGWDLVRVEAATWEPAAEIPLF